MPISHKALMRLKGEAAGTGTSRRTPFYQRFSGRLFALLMLIVIPALALMLYASLRERQIETARVAERSVAIADLVAANQENYVRNVRQLFDTLNQFSFLLLTTNRAFSESHLSNLRKLLPDYLNFGLIETNGMLFCSAEPWTNSVYLGDREYFERVTQTKKLSMGDFQIGRLTHEPSLNFGYPVLNERGELTRVLFASLKLSRLSEAIEQVQVPDGGSIALLDGNGTVLARHAEPGKWIGKRLSDTNALRTILTQKSDVFEATGPDGVSRLYAVKPVEKGRSPALFVTVEVPLTVLFARANQELLARLIFLGSVACGLFFAVRFCAKRFFLAPVKSLAATAERLAHGDLAARVGTIKGTAELVQLGSTLDEMAERTQARTAELEATNGALRAQILEREKAEKQVRQREEEKRKLEEQVLRSQRMDSLGALAGGIAHDLNNALVPVIIGSEMLRQGGENKDRSEVLDLIATSGQRCTAMVKQILTFAKGSRGETDSIPVRHLIEEMAAIARDTFPKNIHVESWCPKNLWNVKGNTTELHQILLNLCVNARDAMPKGGKLKISADNLVLGDEIKARDPDALPGPNIVICVSDTGTGIPPELQSRVFEPFFTTKPADKGTGLGLSTVVNIVKRHHGFVELKSEAAKGTEFKVYIPAVAAADEKASPAKGEALPMGEGEVVLFVDDERSVLELGKSTLEEYGYRLLTAGNGLEAIACFELHKEEISLIVMDADMPFLDGISALKKIRKAAHEVPVIIASASHYDTTYTARQAHVYTLTKPYGVEDLIRAAAKALAKTRKTESRKSDGVAAGCVTTAS